MRLRAVEANLCVTNLRQFAQFIGGKRSADQADFTRPIGNRFHCVPRFKKQKPQTKKPEAIESQRAVALEPTRRQTGFKRGTDIHLELAAFGCLQTFLSPARVQRASSEVF
jgi:hypothetical protein